MHQSTPSLLADAGFLTVLVQDDVPGLQVPAAARSSACSLPAGQRAPLACLPACLCNAPACLPARLPLQSAVDCVVIHATACFGLQATLEPGGAVAGQCNRSPHVPAPPPPPPPPCHSFAAFRCWTQRGSGSWCNPSPAPSPSTWGTSARWGARGCGPPVQTRVWGVGVVAGCTGQVWL